MDILESAEWKEHLPIKGRHQNSTAAVTSLPLKLVTCSNLGVSDIRYLYGSELSQLGCLRFVTVGDITNQLKPPSLVNLTSPLTYYHKARQFPKHSIIMSTQRYCYTGIKPICQLKTITEIDIYNHDDS